MIRRCVVVLAALLAGCGSGKQLPPMNSDRASGSDSDEDFATAVVTEADRLAAEELWPGFEPAVIPVAIYTGEHTLLYRHPSPPEGFREMPDHGEVWVYSGRHPAVTANSTAELGGLRTATLMPDPSDRSVRSWAGTLIHELFHVFQGERYPGWTANEADLFTYPVDSAELLALRRLETEALHRAHAEGGAEQALCWAEVALRIRSQRFSALPPEAVAYERGIELKEGLARYVEHIATREKAREQVLPEGRFPASAVRQRGYATGLALALLLDHVSPDWQHLLDQNPGLTLDGLLAEATAHRPSSICEFDAHEKESAKAEATTDVSALRARRAEQLRAFEEREGWRIRVRAPKEPLFPQGFDPLHVEVVDTGTVLHGRFLKLRNARATVEVLGHRALTVAAGRHPLFNGVRSLVVTGLPEEPTITRSDGTTRVRAEGVQLEITGGAVRRLGRVVEVLLEG